MRKFIYFLLLATSTFAQERVVEPISQETESQELRANGEQIVKIDPSHVLSSQRETLIDIGFYGAVNAGIFQSILPSLGTSIRTQKGANGMELDFSILPYNWSDLNAGLSYKIDFSYLYHFKSKRSGVYLGGGPGFITNSHIFRPLAVTWVGYQFSSPLPKERRIHAFVDGGMTAILERDREVIVLVPTVRGGAGFSF